MGESAPGNRRAYAEANRRYSKSKDQGSLDPSRGMP